MDHDWPAQRKIDDKWALKVTLKLIKKADIVTHQNSKCPNGGHMCVRIAETDKNRKREDE